MPDRLVIGIGNPDRGDDGVGHVVARIIGGVEHNGEATSLLAMLEGADSVWLIDAAESGAPPGTIHRIDCTTGTALPRRTVSSHGFGVAEAIALARALNMLPQHCIVFAIEAAQFEHRAALSPAVEQAAYEVAEWVLAELATQPPPSTRRQRRPAPATDRR